MLKRSKRVLVSSLARNSARLCGQLVCTNEHGTPYSIHMAVHVDRGVVEYFTTPWSRVQSRAKWKSLAVPVTVYLHGMSTLSCFSCRCSLDGLHWCLVPHLLTCRRTGFCQLSEIYAQSFGWFLPRCSEEQGCLRSVKTVYSFKGCSMTALKRHLDTKQQSEVKQQQPQMPAVIIKLCEPAEKNRT